MSPARSITIYCVGGNDYTVQEGEAICDRLCWDEMLGTIAELTHPSIGKARYRMQTAEERDAFEDARRRRLAEWKAAEDVLDKSMLDTLRRAEQKLIAYVGVCADDKELTQAVLPMVRAAIALAEAPQP